jgi:hypothetical protein
MEFPVPTITNGKPRTAGWKGFKEFEDENRRLKHVCAALSSDNKALTEA